MESARGLWCCGGWADPRKRLRGRPVPRETAKRVVRGASTFGGEMGIFSAGSGGLFVAAAGSLELAGIIFRTADDSLDLLGDPCLCILQEFCADRLFPGFRFGVLHVAAAGQPPDHGCSFADAGTGCQAPLAEFAGSHKFDSYLRGREL